MELRNPVSKSQFNLFLQGRIADLFFNFAGSSAPTPGLNTGEFGFCHTTGGSFIAGQVVYDTGLALTILPGWAASAVTSRDAFAGTITMAEDSLYVNENGTWTLKGGTGGGFDVDTIVVDNSSHVVVNNAGNVVRIG